MINRGKALNILNNAGGGSSKLPTATPEEIYETELIMKKTIPDSLRDFYTTYSNGIGFGGLKILPVYSKTNLKKTGDSLSRNNSIEHSPMYYCDPDTIDQFLVFCVGEYAVCYCFSVDGGDTVWQWHFEDSQMIKLDQDFWEWLLDCIYQKQNYLFRY